MKGEISSVAEPQRSGEFLMLTFHKSPDTSTKGSSDSSTGQETSDSTFESDFSPNLSPELNDQPEAKTKEHTDKFSEYESGSTLSSEEENET